MTTPPPPLALRAAESIKDYASRFEKEFAELRRQGLIDNARRQPMQNSNDLLANGLHRSRQPGAKALGAIVRRLQKEAPMEAPSEGGGGTSTGGATNPSQQLAMVDMAIQLSGPFVQVVGVEPEAITLALTNWARASFEDPQVLCYDSNEELTFGIWQYSTAKEDILAARLAGLANLGSLRPQGSVFGAFAAASYLRRLIDTKWNSWPKRYRHQANQVVPDPNGAVHLTGYELRFEAPDRIVISVRGFDETSWPDVDFCLTLTSVFKIDPATLKIQCAVTQTLDIDTSWLWHLAAACLVPLTPLALIFGAEAIYVGAQEYSSTTTASTDPLASFPTEILLPSPIKLAIFYYHASVGELGIRVDGDVLPDEREATVEVVGPRTLVSLEPTVEAEYRVDPRELLPPLSIAWSGDGEIMSRTGSQFVVRFNTSGLRVGHPLTRTERVRVSDPYEVAAEMEFAVKVWAPNDPGRTASEETVPSICKRKPWLMQCRELA